MEDLGFAIGGILSEDEANKLFEEQPEETPEEKTPEEEEQKVTPAEEEPGETHDPSEKVGEEENRETEENAGVQKGNGSSPNFYASIAKALQDDGVFSDLEDSDIEACKTPEDFAELFEKVLRSREDEKTRRVNELLDSGAKPSDVQGFENTLEYLNSLKNEDINNEGPEGEEIRRQLIYNAFIARGFDHDEALKYLERSFKQKTDLEDAVSSLEQLKKHYQGKYEEYQNTVRKNAESAKAEQKKSADQFKKMILEDELKLGETKLDKKTCQQIFDSVTKPVYKDPKTGKLLTKVQKFQQENPLEFLKQLGMWFVLTEGGKNATGFTKRQVNAEKNKSIRELEQKINSSNLNDDGTLRYSGGIGNDEQLLSDGWKVGWGE